jgi:hypothetical protein
MPHKEHSRARPRRVLDTWLTAERLCDADTTEGLLTDDFIGIGLVGFQLPKTAKVSTGCQTTLVAMASHGSSSPPSRWNGASVGSRVARMASSWPSLMEATNSATGPATDVLNVQ